MIRRPRILVIRQLGGIGDILGLSCIYRGLHEKYPNHELVCITSDLYNPGITEINLHNPFIDTIIDITPYEATSAATKRWHPRFSASYPIEDYQIFKEADMIFDMNSACIDGEHRDIQKYGTVVTPRYKIWCDAADVVPSTYRPVYEITNQEQAIADMHWHGITKPIVGMSLGSANPDVDARTLSMDQTLAIANGLAERGIHVVTVDPTRKLAGFPYLIGKRIQELMPLIKRMAAFVTVDTGLLHMAGTVGTPVIGLFGSSDYRMRMAYYKGSAIDSRMLMPCAPCWYNPTCRRGPDIRKHFECLKKIQPEMVVEETMKWV